jgi:hypothetical protein
MIGVAMLDTGVQYLGKEMPYTIAGRGSAA